MYVVTEGVEPNPLLDLRRLHCRSPVSPPQGFWPERLFAFHRRRGKHPVCFAIVRTNQPRSRRDSANAASMGTSFAEASVLGAPWTIITTERRTWITRFSKSTSSHCKPINSPRRKPVKASSSAAVRRGSGSSLSSAHNLVGCQDIGRSHALRTLTYALDRVSFCPLPIGSHEKTRRSSDS